MPAADHLTPIAPGRRWPWLLAIGALLAAALLLRLWGVKQGLPYAYNVDENAHYVPRAIGMFGHSLDPHYYVNPPAYTYVLHAAFAVAYGGRAGVAHAFATDPQGVFVLARVIAAVLSTIAVWLLYLAAARLFDRRVALLAAALLAVAYLPVFYSHEALNDTPMLAPLCLALWGAAGIVRFGRMRDCVWAGLGIGLTCATKYTGGIVALPVLGAIAVHATAGRAVVASRAWAWRALGVMGAVAIVAFVVADPHSVLSWHAFTGALRDQSLAADDVLGKLGLTQRNGYTYYLWTFTWGLGWVPLVAAIAGAVGLLVWDRRAAIVLVPAPIAFVIFMGAQSRHFGRWLLPVVPDRVPARRGRRRARDRPLRRSTSPPGARRAVFAAAALALCLQSAIHSVHSGVVLSRQDTRGLGARVAGRQRRPGDADRRRADRARPVAGRRRPRVAADGARRPLAAVHAAGTAGTRRSGAGGWTNFRNENYERTLSPALVAGYERAGYCWVVTGSTQIGPRRRSSPTPCPQAIALLPHAGSCRHGRGALLALPARRQARASSTSTGHSTAIHWPTSAAGPW